MGTCHLSLFLVIFLFCVNAAAIDVREFFDGTKQELLKAWDPCQADFEKLIDVKRNELLNLIDADREGPDECIRKYTVRRELLDDEPDELERLGPSFILPIASQRSSKDESCGEEVLRDGKKITQRNELRFRLEPRFRHRFTDPHWYAIKFRMDKDIPTCGSVRWVIAQWKYKDEKWGGDLDPSPFLAQRYDNGVLHLTVQNGHCRCMVAKAPGDPNRESAAEGLLSDASIPKDSELMQVKPLECRYSKEGSMSGKRCEPEEFRLLARSAADLHKLPNPKKEWVRMAYWIKGHKGSKRRLDIWADGKFVARIRGMIGYPGGDPRNVKFKFGAYRDKFVYGPPRNEPPSDAHMIVDEICVTKNKGDAISGC